MCFWQNAHFWPKFFIVFQKQLNNFGTEHNNFLSCGASAHNNLHVMGRQSLFWLTLRFIQVYVPPLHHVPPPKRYMMGVAWYSDYWGRFYSEMIFYNIFIWYFVYQIPCPPSLRTSPWRPKLRGGYTMGGAHNGDGGTLRHLGWNQILDI